MADEIDVDKINKDLKGFGGILNSTTKTLLAYAKTDKDRKKILELELKFQQQKLKKNKKISDEERASIEKQIKQTKVLTKT